MDFDVKRDWPIIAAGALGVAAIAAFRSGSGTSSTYGYSAVSDPGSTQIALAKIQADSSNQQAQTAAQVTALQSYLNYINTNHQIDAQSYIAYESLLGQEFAAMEQQTAYGYAMQAQEYTANAQKPSTLQLWLGALSNWVDAYFGGGYQAFQKPQQQNTGAVFA